MKVWTRQDKRVLDYLKNHDTYYCKEEYIDNKMENFSTYYKKLYTWYVNKAKKIVPIPSPEIKYPIWVSPDEDMRLQIVKDTVVFTLEIPDDEIIITDMEKWGYVVNFFYLPLDDKDLKKHQEELEKNGITSETLLFTTNKGNFYPLLKRKIEKSWDRLFMPYTISTTRQGTIWQIKKEQIVDITVLI